MSKQPPPVTHVGKWLSLLRGGNRWFLAVGHFAWPLGSYITDVMTRTSQGSPPLQSSLIIFLIVLFFFLVYYPSKNHLLLRVQLCQLKKKKSKTELTTPACIMVYAIPQQDFVFAIFKKEILFLVLENKGISSCALPRSLGSGCLGAASPCLPYPRHGSNETKMIRGKLDRFLMKGFLSVVSFDLVQWLEVLRRNGIIGNRSSWGWQKQLLLVGTSQTLPIFLQRQIDSSDRLSETIS